MNGWKLDSKPINKFKIVILSASNLMWIRRYFVANTGNE